MTKNVDARNVTGILTRLADNEEGNIIAILAAAVIPVIGLIGGGVDMSRLYLTQSRLQGACDAGALLGRKTMGVGSWDANDGLANTQALKMFDQNFRTGAYGSGNLSRSFTESGGNVVGTASATVPMALMQVLGVKSKVVSVRCQAELRIPNSDVMFVLDTTGSMGDPLAGSSETKISGLRRAVKCFYEALAKQNITDITPADCGETADPTQTNTGAVQLRFGFVPYAINVNVGRLLPHDYLADQWTYQSREATMATEANAAPIYGTESAPTVVSTVDTNLADTAWQNTNQDLVQNGFRHIWYSRVLPAECADRTAPFDTSGPITGANILVSQNPAQPVDPDSTVTKAYQRDTLTGTRTYRYMFTGDKTKTTVKGDCILQFKASGQTNRRVTTSTTTPITWVRSTTFGGWTYKPVTFNVRGLKGTTAGVWNASVSLPLGNEGINTNIPWNGCIEERQTFRGTDTDPSDDWNPVPAAALDMNIDLIPTGDSSTKWGPQLTPAIYARYVVATNPQGVKTLTNTRTLDNVYISRNDNIVFEPSYSNCPSEARKFQTWTPAAFSSYANALTIGGNTYHDIGLLWGARIMSPTGIFAALNAPLDKNIERHMVFMTDGETNVIEGDYSAYGVAWYDRRQTPVAEEPTRPQLNSLTDARTAALCTAIKNKNISLWVVSYGDVTSTTNDRLRACATPGKFFHAASVSSLVANFKAIAAEISALRITE
ncbi:Tad domain-containing protein [Sphingorhabdus sp.]|uniref:Tad domain-containing protein n=1 Tax=Sphingorhabdus sp. TaxID=1902408 RepID=UPI00391A4DD3